MNKIKTPRCRGTILVVASSGYLQDKISYQHSNILAHPYTYLPLQSTCHQSMGQACPLRCAIIRSLGATSKGGHTLSKQSPTSLWSCLFGPAILRRAQLANKPLDLCNRRIEAAAREKLANGGHILPSTRKSEYI